MVASGTSVFQSKAEIEFGEELLCLRQGRCHETVFRLAMWGDMPQLIFFCLLNSFRQIRLYIFITVVFNSGLCTPPIQRLDQEIYRLVFFLVSSMRRAGYVFVSGILSGILGMWRPFRYLFVHKKKLQQVGYIFISGIWYETSLQVFYLF